MDYTQNSVDSRPSTGQTVLVVGAGTAGCLVALELHRLGFEPTLLERKPVSETTGDFVVIGPSCVNFMCHWPHLKADFDQYSQSGCEAYHYRHNGDFIVGPFPLKFATGRPILRRRLQEILEAEVNRAKIPIKFGSKVVQYFEDTTQGGVVLENGQSLVADMVVAADGFQTRSWKIINGKKSEPVPSGLAAFRTTQKMKDLFEKCPDLETNFGCRNGKPYLMWYSGPGTHIVVFADGEYISYVIIHPETENTSQESWSSTVETKTVVAQIKEHHHDWATEIVKIVENTPNNTILDWLLMMRDPQSNWVSPSGRVAACGDSAHPYLPTSANGAVQAMEDAVSLAAALRLGYDKSIPVKESMSVYNEIRFQRTSCAQLFGIANGQTHHHTDWDRVKENPEILTKNGPGTWIASHIPEEYMKTNFDACLKSIREGKPYQNTNIPPGFTYKPWTARKMFELEKQGHLLKLAGDWS